MGLAGTTVTIGLHIAMILFAVSLSPANAATANVFYLQGEITDFNRQSVVLAIERGEIRVPRPLFGKTDIRPGKKVQVKITLDQLVALLSGK